MLENLKKYKIKLASNSPRRRELLSGLGVDYEVKLLPGIDETYPDTLKGEEIPIYIAREKASAYRPSMQADELIITADTIVYIDGEVLGKPKDEEEACQMLRKLSGRSHAYRPSMQADELIITADTIVYIDGEVLGKPKDEEEACQMLRKLSGRSHQVITGVCLMTTEFQKSFASVTEVTFDQLSEEDIRFYVEHYRPMDKAGSYGVQEWIGFIGVTGLKGSYFNVMGLPVQRLYQELRKL